MFFKDTAEIAQYIDLNASFKFALISPKLKTIDRDILKLHFGFDFVEEVQTDYDALLGAPITGLPLHTQKIIEKFRAITAPLAYALYISPGQIQIDSAGVFVAKGENRGIAWEWQIEAAIKSFLTPGYQAIEDAILFLQKNIVNYVTYQNSDEFTYSKSCFIPSAKEFTKYYTPLKNSYMSFCLMRSCMDKVDMEDVANVVLPDYYALLKSRLLSNTLTIPDQAIIPYIKKAIANLTVCKAMSELNVNFDKDGFVVYDNTSGVKLGASTKTALGEPVTRAQDSLFNSGQSALADLKKFMEKNIASYAVYKLDSQYVIDQSITVINVKGQSHYNAL